MINFVVPKENTEVVSCYTNVIKAFINPILPHLKCKYQTANEAYNDAVNVIFFTEDGVFKEINADKTNGINVFMSHGIADKNWRTFARTDKFDYVFTSGDLWKEKLIKQGMNPDKILINGYTRLEETYKKQDTYEKKCKDKKTILFAPTHNNYYDNICIYDRYADLMELVKDKYNVLISNHPHNKDSRQITSDEYLEADVVIADFGSTIYEALSLDKPVVFLDYLVGNTICEKSNGSFEQYIYMNKIGYHASDINDAVFLIDEAINCGVDRISIEFINGILPKELRGNSGIITAKYLMEIDKKLQRDV